MSSSLVARRGATAALAVIATAALFLIGFAPGSASAAAVTKGSVVLTIPSGKAGKVSAVSPAKVTKRFGKKGAKVSAAAKGGSFGEKVATGLQAAGALKLANGKRSVKISGLKLAIDRKLAVVRGNVAGKKNIVVFTAAGKGTFGADPATAKFTAGKLKFPASVAKLVKNRLKLKKAPNGRLGTLFVNASRTETDPCVVDPNAPGCNPDPCEANPDAEGCPIVDPYLAQCDVAATSKVTGALPGAAVLPTLTDPQAINGLSTVSWGIKQSFRSYVTNTAGPGAANGSLHALDGASFGGTEPHNTATDPINWTFVNGTLSENGTPNNPGDDKAIVNLDGAVVFCATGHNFRVAISDPTIVIDEEESRIIADVDSNLAGVWTPTQRVDLADVSLLGGGSARSFLPDAIGTKFENLVVSMTETGGKAICGVSDPRCNYTTGTPMDDLTFDAPTGELVDQYNAQCGVDVVSRQINAWEDAAALPNMSGALATTEPTAINWGFKQSFRGYVFGAPPAGTLQALDGASRAAGMDPTRGFTFPVSGGSYRANDPGDNSDDQAVIPGSGTALFCKAGHWFWLSISDPTIVIDGENSRIVATVSENSNGGDPGTGPWKTPQRIDLANLDLSNVTPIYNKSGSEVTWTNIPVSLATALNQYPEGEALDPITVTVKTPYDTGAGDAAAWDALATYVQANLQFPNSDPATGGCEVGVPAGGSATNARTIDEHAALGGTTSTWSASPSPAAAAPSLTGTAVTGGNFNWGFRSSLRGSLNSTGQFNLAGGATASNTPYYGTGPGATPPPAVPGVGQMSGAGKFFTWPAVSGTYKANGIGDADDQLVLRTEGTVAFCQTQTAQRYGIIFANPTVVIDGANSRITIDVAVRYRLSWAWATVDFATLDMTDPNLVTGSTTDAGVVTKSWTFPDAVSNVGPVELTADGEKMAKMLSSAYVAGLGLDGATIRASFPE